MKSKEQKAREAEVRQAVYDSLTPLQKITKLNMENFVANKERRKNGFLRLDLTSNEVTMEDF